VHQTLADIRDKIGLTIAPPSQGHGPLLRAAQVVHLLTALDHVAVGKTGHGRQELIIGDRDHGLVEHGQTRFDLPTGQSRAPLENQGNGRDVGLPESFGDLKGLGGGVEHGVKLAGIGVLECGGEEDKATFGAVNALAFNEALGAAQPASCRSSLAADAEDGAKPAGTLGGGQGLGSVEVRAIGPAHRAGEVLVASTEVGRPGE
jgi:hypothetical protein